MSVESEFATVDAVLASGAPTAGVDAFALSLIKSERQMRKLFTHLVFQSPAFAASDVKQLRGVLASTRRVYFDGFISGWDALYVQPIRVLVGADHDRLLARLGEAIDHRNKIFHGQLTDHELSRDALLAYVTDIRMWCQSLCAGARLEVGYDGFGRNSFQKSPDLAMASRLRVRLANAEEYGEFIRTHVERASPRSTATAAIRASARRSIDARPLNYDVGGKRIDAGAILSVDLAYRTYSDIGVVALSSEDGNVRCDLVPLPLDGVPDPTLLAQFLVDYCNLRQMKILVLDGPQGWKSDTSRLLHARCCEQELNTPAKSGLPGSVKPAGYRPFVEFSIAVFDELSRLQWNRFSSLNTMPSADRGCSVESFPLSAWKSLGIKGPPAKAKAKPSDVDAAFERLQRLVPMRIAQAPNHDELQAMVAGLAGLAVGLGSFDGCVMAGVPPTLERGIWREGYIVNPLPGCPPLQVSHSEDRSRTVRAE